VLVCFDHVASSIVNPDCCAHARIDARQLSRLKLVRWTGVDDAGLAVSQRPVCLTLGASSRRFWRDPPRVLDGAPARAANRIELVSALSLKYETFSFLGAMLMR
jgi:hypothetical protein